MYVTLRLSKFSVKHYLPILTRVFLLCLSSLCELLDSKRRRLGLRQCQDRYAEAGVSGLQYCTTVRLHAAAWLRRSDISFIVFAARRCPSVRHVRVFCRNG